MTICFQRMMIWQTIVMVGMTIDYEDLDQAGDSSEVTIQSDVYSDVVVIMKATSQVSWAALFRGD